MSVYVIFLSNLLFILRFLFCLLVSLQLDECEMFKLIHILGGALLWFMPRSVNQKSFDRFLLICYSIFYLLALLSLFEFLPGYREELRFPEKISLNKNTKKWKILLIVNTNLWISNTDAFSPPLFKKHRYSIERIHPIL